MSKLKLSHELIPEKQIDWKDDILKSITLGGRAEIKEKAIIGSFENRSSILDLSNGAVRISRTTQKKAILILGQPSILAGFKSNEIRCALCGRIISYPSWYYSLNYAVNQFHYFICFDESSKLKPSVKCYRRV